MRSCPLYAAHATQAGASCADLDAIAATQGPGLVGSLLVGLTYAKALCFTKIPLIAVNHVEGHIHAVVMEAAGRRTGRVSRARAGGERRSHTPVSRCTEGSRYRLLGKTRDDAAGEAFDKVAKLLGFGYPGGPVWTGSLPHGDPDAVRFTLAKMKGNTMDFSFSGLKTAVLRWFELATWGKRLRLERNCCAHNPRPEHRRVAGCHAEGDTGSARLVSTYSGRGASPASVALGR